MKATLIKICSIGLAGLFSASSAFAGHCKGDLHVSLSQAKQTLAQWTGTPAQIQKIKLDNGLLLGVKIESAAREVYLDSLASASQSKLVELVKISLYDMSAEQPRYLVHTFGATNSTQTYGQRGGAARLDEVGSNEIRFALSKPTCTLNKKQIASLPTAQELGQQTEMRTPGTNELAWIEQARNEIQAGTYTVVYPENAMPEKVRAKLSNLLEEKGIKVLIIAQNDERNKTAFFQAYGRTMMNAIIEKFGPQTMREIEQKLKQAMAE